ncbi:hypothetical protein GGX14DRAFT_587510 [Mycena pura]|uniref:Uncharacterized protein n=1 Tax=Mycena pura TaxID=153505 RepID=A0AAD6Y0R9_9AGAR|nr:hypothetical protein GGX14DRAFT_587510 [Mycena pura]
MYRAAKTWLVRSGSCPLSIKIKSFVEGVKKEALILSHRSRWECVVIDIPWDSRFLPDIASYPLLRQLDITGRFDNPSPELSPGFTFSDAPSLRTATLGDFDYPSGFLPWHQLTSLCLVSKTPAECTDVLKETINLINCRLIIARYSEGEVGVNLPRLESLALEHFLHCPTTCTITTFVVPSLRRLRIADVFIRPDPVGKLSSLIGKSGCKLQELCIIGDLSITKKNVYREAFPSISNLSFDRATTLIYWQNGTWR